jgi:hypothetical protein
MLKPWELLRVDRVDVDRARAWEGSGMRKLERSPAQRNGRTTPIVNGC